MRKSLHFSMAALFCAAVFCGCGNVIRTYDEIEDRIDRTVIGTKHAVVFTPAEPSGFEFTATAANVTKQKVKKYQVFVHGEMVTPYEGWRECYEMPCGLLLVPVSLCSHILSVFTFGVYPFSFSNNVTDLAYSGLNPCLNWESETRLEKCPLEAKDKLVDESEEDQVSPIPNAVINVSTGGAERRFATDKFGAAKIVLVGLTRKESLFGGDRLFRFTIAGDKELTREWLISRQYANRLLRARAAIMRYESAPSGKELVQAVKTLESLKFTGLAYQFERGELEKHRKDEAFMREFNDVSLE